MAPNTPNLGINTHTKRTCERVTKVTWVEHERLFICLLVSGLADSLRIVYAWFWPDPDKDNGVATAHDDVYDDNDYTVVAAAADDDDDGGGGDDDVDDDDDDYEDDDGNDGVDGGDDDNDNDE